MRNKFDLVIVGGGVIGLMTAALAAIRKPKIKIAVIDKNMLGYGATLYSAAFSTPLCKSNISRDLISRGLNVMDELRNHISIEKIIKKCMYIVSNNDVNRFFESYTENDLISCEDKILSENALRYPLTVPKDKRIFIANDSAHYVNAIKLIESLSFFLRENDCAIFESCVVNSIEKKMGQPQINCANGIQIKSKTIVITTGPWKNKFSLLGIEAQNKKFLTKKIAALHLGLKPNKNDPAIVFFSEDAFLLPLIERNHWLFSFTSEDWDKTPEAEMTISQQDLEISKSIFDLYSMEYDKYYSGGRVFCDSYSPHKEVSIENLDNNIFVVSGASGSGYRFSYGIADKLLKEF